MAPRQYQLGYSYQSPYQWGDYSNLGYLSQLGNGFYQNQRYNLGTGTTQNYLGNGMWASQPDTYNQYALIGGTSPSADNRYGITGYYDNSNLDTFSNYLGDNTGSSVVTPTATPTTSDDFWGRFFGANNKGGYMGGIAAGIGALGSLAGTIGSIWQGSQANKLAKQQLAFQKDLAYTNLNNQIQSYNNSLTDRLQARAAMETGDKNAYDDEIEARSLKRNPDSSAQ